MGGVVAHVILVSAQGPNPSFFFFGGAFIQLGGLFGQGLRLGLGPGLDNNDAQVDFARGNMVSHFLHFTPFKYSLTSKLEFLIS